MFDKFVEQLEQNEAAGEDLSYLPEFVALETRLEKASRKSRLGTDENLGDSSPINWSGVFQDCLELSAKGNDLRVLTIAVRAQANLAHFEGLAKGLDFLRHALANRWSALHPEIKERDTPEASARKRMSALYDLGDDNAGALAELAMSFILDIEGVIQIRGRELSRGGLSETEFMKPFNGLPDNEQELRRQQHSQMQKDAATVCRAMQQHDPAQYQAKIDACGAALSALDSVETTFNTAAGIEPNSGERLEFEDLRRFLLGCQAAMVPSAAAPAAQSETQADGAASPDKPVVIAGGGGLPSQISTREEVDACLDLIIKFYEANEPASPIPLLIQRVKRMVPMDFMELISEIAPGAVNDVKKSAGIDSKRRSDQE